MADRDFARLSLVDWTEAAKRLRAADRDPGTTAVLIEAAGVRHAGGVDEFLRRLETVSVPTVAVLSGQCDASGLTVLAAASLGFVADDVEVSVAAGTVLALGLTWSLPAAVGAAPARGLLLGADPLDANLLRTNGLARHGEDPAVAARRLATDPDAALLVRSLRVAARSSAEQARRYDAELRLLDQAVT